MSCYLEYSVSVTTLLFYLSGNSACCIDLVIVCGHFGVGLMVLWIQTDPFSTKCFKFHVLPKQKHPNMTSENIYSRKEGHVKK